MRIWRLIVVLLAIAASGHGTAVAQTPVGDSAVGSGGTEFFSEFHFDVRGGPSGEGPMGTSTLFIVGFGSFELTRIDCLSVSGSTATFAGPLGPNGSGFAYGKTTVVDGGTAGTGDTYGSAGFDAPTDCSPYPEASRSLRVTWSCTTRNRCPPRGSSATTAAGATFPASRTTASASASSPPEARTRRPTVPESL